MYENSRFLKNRFTFCGVNINFGQQWAPPAYYHLTPIVSKGKHWVWYNCCEPRPQLTCFVWLWLQAVWGITAVLQCNICMPCKRRCETKAAFTQGTVLLQHGAALHCLAASLPPDLLHRALFVSGSGTEVWTVWRALLHRALFRQLAD